MSLVPRICDSLWNWWWLDVTRCIDSLRILVGSLKLYVSFAKEPYKRDDIRRCNALCGLALNVLCTTMSIVFCICNTLSYGWSTYEMSFRPELSVLQMQSTDQSHSTFRMWIIHNSVYYRYEALLNVLCDWCRVGAVYHCNNRALHHCVGSSLYLSYTVLLMIHILNVLCDWCRIGAL